MLLHTGGSYCRRFLLPSQLPVDTTLNTTLTLLAYFCSNSYRLESATLHIHPALVAALKAGDEQALKSILEVLGPKVYHYCKKKTGSAEDAQELLQDVFLKLWQFREKLDTTANLQTLIFVITRNHLLNFARKKVAYELTPTGTIEHYQVTETQEHQTSYEELWRQYNRVMGTLGQKSREVFRLSREEGLSHKEIADRLGISVRTVETHISNVLGILRAELKDSYILLVLFFFR